MKFFLENKIFPLFNNTDLSLNDYVMTDIEEELLFVYNRLNDVNKQFNNYKHSNNLKIDELIYNHKNLELDFKYLNVEYETIKNNIDSHISNKTYTNNNDNSKNNKEIIKICVNQELIHFQKILVEYFENINNLITNKTINIEDELHKINKNIKSLENKIDLFNEKNKILLKEEIKNEIKNEIINEVKNTNNDSNIESPSKPKETNLFKRIFNEFSIENANLNVSESIQEQIDLLNKEINEIKLNIKNEKTDKKIMRSKIDNLLSMFNTKNIKI